MVAVRARERPLVLGLELVVEFLQYQLADSGASTLITDRAGLLAVRALDSVPALRRIVVAVTAAPP